MSTLGQGSQGPQAGTQAPNMLDIMKAARIWLLWKSIPNPDPNKKPHKVPFYVDGAPRQGTLDTPDDRARLVTYQEAASVLEREHGAYTGLAIALGPDGRGGCWQGTDLDDVEAKGLADIANRWGRGDSALWGYVELSPSGTGVHIIGYGRHFPTLGSNGTGIEAYAGGRFFTFTGISARHNSPCRPVDLADYVEKELAPRHGIERTAYRPNGAETVQVDPKTVTDLRSALLHVRADAYDVWFRMGLALKELGETGRGLWLDWSATSDKFNPKEAARKWDGFVPRDTGYQAVFAEAQRQGWVNPASNGAQPGSAAPPPNPSTITLEFAMSSDTATVALEYLVDPYLPARCVVGFYGRGSSAKSSFLATIAAEISGKASTLWVSVEEPVDWIKVRHIRCGGLEKTLAVVKAVATKKDGQGRTVGSTFNAYEHLETALVAARAGLEQESRPPLRLVVLDTAVGLTGWTKGESPNDDASVKRLLGFLQALAERHNLTIAIVGHANKGKHDHFADTVMGATAWTNSPRLSFVHAADAREDYAYVLRVAKTNLVTFGATYRTEAIHTLYARENGPDSVLVRVVPGPVVWGDRDSLEMFEEATKKPKGDEQGDGFDGGHQKPKLADIVIGQISAAVRESAEPVTREMIEARMGREISRRDWKKIDEQLLALQLLHKVAVEVGQQNKVLYRSLA